MGAVCLCVDGADVYEGVALVVGDAAVGEGGYTKDDEDDAEDCGGFHKGRV